LGGGADTKFPSFDIDCRETLEFLASVDKSEECDTTAGGIDFTLAADPVSKKMRMFLVLHL